MQNIFHFLLPFYKVQRQEICIKRRRALHWYIMYTTYYNINFGQYTIDLLQHEFLLYLFLFFKIVAPSSNFHWRIPLGMGPLTQNFRSLGWVTAVRRALKVLVNHYIRSNFQSWHFWLKLKIQSPLTLLVPKIPSLSILSPKCGFYSVKLACEN